MLHMFLISGAIFNTSSASVGITPPDFGSSLDEIVPPVIITTTFLNLGFFLEQPLFSLLVSLSLKL